MLDDYRIAINTDNSLLEFQIPSTIQMKVVKQTSIDKVRYTIIRNPDNSWRRDKIYNSYTLIIVNKAIYHCMWNILIDFINNFTNFRRINKSLLSFYKFLVCFIWFFVHGLF